MSSYRVPVFNGDQRNYELWEIKFLGLMRIKKLISVFKDNETPDVDANAEAFAELIQCLDDRSLSLIIRDANDQGKEALNILRSHYRPKGKSRIITLYHELTSLTLTPGESMTDFIIRAETAANALRQIGETVSDSLLISMVLKGLPSSYTSFVTVTTQRESQQSFSEFKESLRNQEESVTHQDNPAVMSLQRKPQNQRWCSSCKSNSHSTEACYTKKPSTDPSPSSASGRHYNYNHNRFCTKCKSKSHDTKSCRRFCDYHQNDSHWTSQCRNKQHHHVKQASNSNGESNPNNDHFTFTLNHPFNKSAEPETSVNFRLLVDSGASTHIINNQKYFTSLDKNFRSEKHTIQLADGTKTKNTVQAQGNAEVIFEDTRGNKQKVLLKNALFVPSFQQNIFSIPAATNEGATVNFYNNAGILQFGDSSFHIKKTKNLYYINNVVKSCVEQTKTLQDWHNILGHCNVRDILKLQDHVDGMKIIGTKTEQLNCETCLLGKMNNVRNKQPDVRAKAPLDLIHLDLAGPIEPIAKNGFKFALICVDDYSNLVCVYFLKHKSDTMHAFRKFLCDMSPYGKVKKVRSDQGGEFISNEFSSLLMNNFIRHEKSAPYSPHQNGTAERHWRTLFEMGRCILLESKLPKYMWTYAIMASAYIRNRCFNQRIGKTPFEAVAKRKPNISNMHTFGQTCFALNQNPKKLDPRSEKGIFVGYDRDSPAYLVYFPNNGRVKKERCVKFFDSNEKNECDHNVTVNKNENNPRVECSENENVPFDIENPTLPNIHVPPSQNEDDNAFNNGSTTTTNVENGEPNPCGQSTTENDEKLCKRKTKTPKRLDDYYLYAADTHDQMNVMTHYCYVTNAPQCYSEAMSSPDAEKWEEAMTKEMEALAENDTYNLVPLPNDRKVIGGKWVYAIKKGTDNNVIHKARFVAKGCSQTDGIDYEETFSPTAKMNSIRILTQIAIHNDLQLHQMDVKSAYLNAQIDCDIYVQQPKGFEKRGKNGEDLVLKLNKSLYGLKQSGRNWNDTFNAYLTEHDLQRSVNEPCLYFNKAQNIFLLIWVDDILIAAKPSDMSYIKDLLEQKFKMKDLGPTSCFLGIEFQIENGTISMNQSNFISTILMRFGMHDCKPRYTPCEMKPMHDSEPLNANELTLYKQIVGALIYVMTATRPDLSFTVTRLAQHMSNAQQCHMTMAKHTLRYMKGTIDLKLTFRKCDEPLQVIGFCDADWGNCEDRKSITGYCFQMSKKSAMISWKSRKQPTIALSTCEAEYMSLVSAIQEGKYLVSLLKEVTTMDQTYFNLFCDNQGTIALAKNPIKHQRSKHIDIKYHFIRDEISEKRVNVKYIPTENNIADVFTKPVSKMRNQKFKMYLMG